MPASRERWLLLVLVPVLAFPVVYLSLAQPRPLWDEGINHLPVIERFGPGLPGLDDLRGYTTAVGPLFYVVFANLGALFGNSLFGFRLVVFLLAAANVLLFYATGRRFAPERRIAPLLLLASYPYFFTLSGLLMSEHLALFFGLLALLGYLRWTESSRAGPLAVCLLAAALAIPTRQFYAFLPVGLTVAEFLRARGPRRAHALVFLLPLLSLVPLLLAWHGLTPPAVQGVHTPGFSPPALSSVLVWTGLFFLPHFITGLARQRFRPSPWLAFALPAVPLALLFPPSGTGLTRTILDRLPAPLSAAAAALLALLGAGYLITVILRLKTSPPARRAPAIAGLFVLLVLTGIGPLVFERYFLPGFVLLLLFELPDIRTWWATAWSLGFQMPLAIVQLLRLAPVAG